MMRRIKKSFLLLLVMSGFSFGMLLALSALTYMFKWKAEEVLIGITGTYIMTGFVGGIIAKLMSYETHMGKKLIEGCLAGTLFMVLLLGLSFLFMGSEATFGRNFLLIWTLIAGSAALGRLL